MEIKYQAWEEILFIARQAIQPRGRSGADTRSQEQEARLVDSSLGLKLGFGLTLGSEIDGQTGLELGSGHGPSPVRY